LFQNKNIMFRFYVGKVFVQKEEDYVDFIYQCGINCFTNKINKNNNLLYNKIGATKIQNYFPGLCWVLFDVIYYCPVESNRSNFTLDTIL